MPPVTERQSRAAFPLIKEIVTRWADYDMLQHVNNVQYYRYFEFLILDNLADLGADWVADAIIPFVVESNCHFRKPLPRAKQFDGGLRITRIGHSSVRYEIALFEQAAQEPSAVGFFVHVYIDRETGESVAIPERIRNGLAAILVNPDKLPPPPG